MRDVTKPNFCKSCMEGLWLQLLRRVNLIDDITQSCKRLSVRTYSKTLSLKLVPLAHLRDADNIVWGNEKYTIKWKRNGVEMPEFQDRTEVSLGTGLDGILGNWTAQVTFSTNAIRVLDPALVNSATIEVRQPCS